MHKDIFIRDNVFKNPEVIDTLMKQELYFAKGVTNKIDGARIHGSVPGRDNIIPTGNWSGFRSRMLAGPAYNSLNNHLVNVMKENEALAPFNYGEHFVLNTFFHITTEELAGQEDKWWHVDSDAWYAAVIYLDKDPEPDSGTSVIIDDQTYTIENKYNRMVMYSGKLRHRPNKPYGNEFSHVRKTISTFVHTFK